MRHSDNFANQPRSAPGLDLARLPLTCWLTKYLKRHVDFGIISSATSESAMPYVPTYPSPAPQKKKVWPWVLAAIGAVLVLALTLILGIALGKVGSSSNGEPEEPVAVAPSVAPDSEAPASSGGDSPPRAPIFNPQKQPDSPTGELSPWRPALQSPHQPQNRESLPR